MRPRRHASKYHKIDCDGAQVDALLVDLFLEAHERAPREIVLDLDNTDIPLHGEQEGRFFHGYYTRSLAVAALFRVAVKWEDRLQRARPQVDPRIGRHGNPGRQTGLLRKFPEKYSENFPDHPAPNGYGTLRPRETDYADRRPDGKAIRQRRSNATRIAQRFPRDRHLEIFDHFG